jgi:hypothetical protein
MSALNRSTLFLSLTASVCLLVSSCLADSQVRIVRLSSVQGDVQIDRATGEGFERAFDNLPITQGAKIKTRADGRAEVEFEDGSTVRLAPLSVVEFSTLSLRDSGAKVSTVDVKHGIAYVNFAGKKDDEFTLNFDKEHIAVADSAHFRVFVAEDGSMVSVFNGNLMVDGPNGQVAVEKKHSASFFADAGKDKVAKSVPDLEFDDWDKSQQQYHERYMAKSYNDYSPYAYGVSDMNYYGSFLNVPGYGMAWQPYFAGGGWDPYMNGSWAYYPGAGYTWVSAYPWGWTPYHTGSWINVPGYGYVWTPGGTWAGYGRTPVSSGISRSGLQAPGSGTRTLLVNRGPVSAMRSNKIVINSGSAGLGVQRGSLRNPAQISQRVAERGTVSAGIRNTPITASAATYNSAAQSNSGGYYGSATSGRTLSAPAGRSTGGGGGSGGGRSSASPSAGTRR